MICIHSGSFFNFGLHFKNILISQTRRFSTSTKTSNNPTSNIPEMQFFHKLNNYIQTISNTINEKLNTKTHLVEDKLDSIISTEFLNEINLQCQELLLIKTKNPQGDSSFFQEEIEKFFEKKASLFNTLPKTSFEKKLSFSSFPPDLASFIRKEVTTSVFRTNYIDRKHTTKVIYLYLKPFLESLYQNFYDSSSLVKSYLN